MTTSMLELLIVITLLAGAAFGGETSTTDAPAERSPRLDDGGRGMNKKPNYLPYRHAASGVMKKSGTNVNWSVWKGDEGADDDISDDTEGKWPSAAAPWAADPWAVDPTYLMALKNAMVDIKADAKPGFLAKLGSDPALLLIAASIPISLLLAAVLPTLMNMLMNGSNVPLISTTATGGNGASRNIVDEVDILPYLTPVMEAIGAFGVRSIANPQCTQRILCQVAEDRISASKAFYLRKALKIARAVSDGSWLESFGVKELVDSLGDGKCEDIPCATKDNAKSNRFSRKLTDDENTP